MADETEAGDRELGRQLATLSYSQLTPAVRADAITAAGWWNLLGRLGLRIPLVVVHDFGLVLSGGRLGAARQIRHDGAGGPQLARYQSLLARVAAADAIAELAAAPLKDEMLAVILARLLGDVYLRWVSRGPTPYELPTASAIYEIDREALARAHDPSWALGFIQRLIEHERGVLARLDQIEAGSLRLLGLFSAEGGAADLTDLYRLVGAAGATDVVDFSLQLLPSLLETKRRPAAQRFSIDGYVSIERRGNADALLPGELAHDDDVFEQKALSDDLLYYGHERQNERAAGCTTSWSTRARRCAGRARSSPGGWRWRWPRSSRCRGGTSGCVSSTAGFTRGSTSGGPRGAICRACWRSGRSAAATRRASSPTWPPRSPI